MLTRIVAAMLIVSAALIASGCSEGKCSTANQTSTSQDKSVPVTSAVACKIAQANNVQIPAQSFDYKPTAICKTVCGSDFIGCSLDYDYQDKYLDVNGAYDGGNTVDQSMAVCPAVASGSVSVDCSLCGN